PFDANEGGVTDGTASDVGDAIVDDACIMCGGASLVDTSSDPANCGGCGIGCAGTCTFRRCVMTLATGQDRPFALVIDQTNAYWTNSSDGGVGTGSVASVPLAGGTTRTPAGGQTVPQYLAVGGANLYWTTRPKVRPSRAAFRSCWAPAWRCAASRSIQKISTGPKSIRAGREASRNSRFGVA